MNDLGIVIGRPISGISLNGLEYLLENQGGNIKHFPSQEEARFFLMENGVNDNEVEEFEFRRHLQCPHCNDEQFVPLDDTTDKCYKCNH